MKTNRRMLLYPGTQNKICDKMKQLIERVLHPLKSSMFYPQHTTSCKHLERMNLRGTREPVDVDNFT